MIRIAEFVRHRRSAPNSTTTSQHMIHTDNRSERQTEIYNELLAAVESTKSLLGGCNDEAQTKFHLINPVIQLLGYRGLEVDVEHPIDVGGWKVDYALMRDGEPLVLIEAKKLGHSLGKAETDQLTRYFPHSVARFGLLTDGRRYIWFKKRTKRRKVYAERFLVHDTLAPTEMETEWLAAVSYEGFDADELDALATRMHIEYELHEWIVGTFLQTVKDDTKLRQLRDALGLKSVELGLLQDAANRAMRRVIADHSSGQQPATIGYVSPPDADIDNPSKSKLKYVERKGQSLDVGNGVVLEASKWSRAWRVAGGEWNVETTATAVTTRVLGLLLCADTRRYNEESLANDFGLIFSVTKPDQWVEQIPGFSNVYYEKGIPNQAKVDLLKEVVANLKFDPPDDSPLRMKPEIECWLVSVRSK